MGEIRKMNNAEFFEALKLLEKEKGIPGEYLLEKIRAAIIIAVKRDFGGKENIVVYRYFYPLYPDLDLCPGKETSLRQKGSREAGLLADPPAFTRFSASDAMQKGCGKRSSPVNIPPDDSAAALFCPFEDCFSLRKPADPCSLCLLLFVDQIDPVLMSGRSGKWCIQECVQNLYCQSRSYHSAAKRQDIRVIVLSRSLCTKAVGTKRRADSRNPVCCDRDTDPGTADQHAFLAASVKDRGSNLSRIDRIINRLRAVTSKILVSDPFFIQIF